MPGAPDLRLIVITDRRLAAPRDVTAVVEAAVAAGAPAIQLRDKHASPRDLADMARALVRITRPTGALLFINDRIDVALATGADGVHLGPDDIPVDAARRIAPPDFLIGYSTDSPERARAAATAGATYIGCGAVFGTTTKADAADERIGTTRLDEVARAVDVPVIGIGGITLDNISQVAATAAAGAAVVSAVMNTPDPAHAVHELLASFQRGGTGRDRRDGR